MRSRDKLKSLNLPSENVYGYQAFTFPEDLLEAPNQVSRPHVGHVRN